MLEIYADGHTRKGDRLVSVGVAVYNSGKRNIPIYKTGALIRKAVSGTVEGEYLSVAFAIKEALKYNLKGPATLINDNDDVITYLNNGKKGSKNSAHRKYNGIIKRSAERIPIITFFHDIRLTNQRFKEAHILADNNWNKTPISFSLESLLA